MTWKGKTEKLSSGEQDTTNLGMELTAACVALETIDEGHVVSEEAARRPATSAFLTEAEHSEASLLGDWGDLVVWSGACREPFLPRVTFLPPKPADRVDHCLGIDDLALT